MANEIITRAEARAKGLKRYFTSKPCKNHHVAERQTSTGLCLECKRGFDSAYYQGNKNKFREDSRRWRNENRERYRKRKREWAANNKDKMRPYQKEHYQRNKERERIQLQEWRSKNPDKVKEQGRRYRARNPDSAKAKYQRWAVKNQDSIKVIAHRRRARFLQAEGSHTTADLKAILVAQSHKCAYCRIDLRKAKRHLDHIMPLALGGTNDRRNLQYLCAGCNLSKGAAHPIAFAQERGLLL